MSKLKVLVACEYSGVVRDAFSLVGCDSWSCDLLSSETAGQHHQGYLDDILYKKSWDLLIAHPPCTHLAVSGARWFKNKWDEHFTPALRLVETLLESPITYIALENPIGTISRQIRKPDQIIQPWQFGHGETKATCLWLKNLPKLIPTNIVEGREARVHRMTPSANRAKERSRTLSGIAKAMAEQWTYFIKNER